MEMNNEKIIRKVENSVDDICATCMHVAVCSINEKFKEISKKILEIDIGAHFKITLDCVHMDRGIRTRENEFGNSRLNRGIGDLNGEL